MKLSAIVSLIFLSPVIHAKTLNCQILLNTASVYKTNLQTELNKKTRVGRSHGVTAYVTEKDNSNFLVESYLQVEDVRLYAQGILKNPSESIIASLWSRDNLVDVACMIP